MTRRRTTAYVFRSGSALSHRFRCLLESRGVSISRSPLAHGVQRLRLLRAGRVRTVLDVGANVGNYGQALRWAGYRGMIVSYEPMQDAFDKLANRAASDSSWLCRQVALGGEAGKAELNVARDGVSSSLRSQLPGLLAAAPMARYDGVESVMVTTLDEERARWREGDPVFLKLDVQGFEAEVLQGARRTLEGAAGVEMELSLSPLYDGQALFEDQVVTMLDLGFELVSLENVFVDQHLPRLLQVDGLFARRDALLPPSAPGALGE